MSQSDGAIEAQGLAFELAHELPTDPHAAEVTRAKAAATVAEFARASSLDSLDAVLLAAQSGQQPARSAVREASDRARLVDAEVRRFRELAQRG